MKRSLFFKYQKPGHLEFNMLSNGLIFFASPTELNDGSECRPRLILNGSNELWSRLGWHYGNAIIRELYLIVNQAENSQLICETAEKSALHLKKIAGRADFDVNLLSKNLAKYF